MNIEFFEGKTILIIGASGFIGQHLLRRLSMYSNSIVTLQRNAFLTSLPVKQYHCNITDGDLFHQCFASCNPDIVIHLAGDKRRTATFHESVHENVIGTLNVFTEAMKGENLQSLIVMGTASEYGSNLCPFKESMREKPIDAYSFSKACISHMALLFYSLYHLPVTVLRPTIAYGPGQKDDMFLSSLISSLLNDRSFNMTPGEQTRDFVYIDDLVEAILSVPLHPESRGEIINIGNGVPIRILDVARLVESITEKRNLLMIGVEPYRKNEILNYYVDINKARTFLQWEPKTPFIKGLRETIESHKRMI